MADIKQAAKWMQEGRKVRRSTRSFIWQDWKGRKRPYAVRLIRRADGINIHAANFGIEDILADDWEIAEDNHAK